jgi:hypothetical protein
VFFTSLAALADQLARALPDSVKGVPSFDQKRFNWDVTEYRWFPGARMAN